MAKSVCFYVASLLEKNKIKIAESAEILSFLISGIEEANTEEELKILSDEMSQRYPKLPTLHFGI